MVGRRPGGAGGALRRVAFLLAASPTWIAAAGGPTGVAAALPRNVWGAQPTLD